MDVIKTGAAASARLCVETLTLSLWILAFVQPPPHGCVLKPLGSPRLGTWREAAASARLCVETSFWIAVPVVAAAAAFGQLCVETGVMIIEAYNYLRQPPSGGCVLKQFHRFNKLPNNLQPPSRDCVLK